MIGKTFVAKPAEVEHKWYVVDASGKRLGIVVVVNAEKIELAGAKADKKVYRRHTMYPGGLRETPYRKMLAEHPERVVELAVKGMLPKNKLGEAMFMKLKVYAGANHPHGSQAPQPLEIGARANA
jgi:large subunit ribosomal protein L13